MLRLVLMVAGIWFSFAYFGIHEAVGSLLIAQAISYFPMMLALIRLFPAIGRTETLSYVLFLVLTSMAAGAAVILGL
jgi:hypothetical protein